MLEQGEKAFKKEKKTRQKAIAEALKDPELKGKIADSLPKEIVSLKKMLHQAFLHKTCFPTNTVLHKKCI
jgi:hypothetical protein